MSTHDGDAPKAVTWEAPGPGFWELDQSHFSGGSTPLLQMISARTMSRGMRRMFAELGAPLDTLQPAFVNGFFYSRLRPLIRPDKPATKLPPLWILKTATRLHPEMRRRAKTSATSLSGRPWRAVVERWETTTRHDVERANLALQDVCLADLDDGALIAHTRRVLDHGLVHWEMHFYLHGFDLGPIGYLLYDCQEWGIAPADVIPLLEGASPSTTAPLAAVERIRASVDASGCEPASLGELRSLSPEIAADLDLYLRYRGSLLFSRYDLDGVTLGERPDLVLQTIMSGQERAAGVPVEVRIASVRERVAPEHRVTFDERLTEARAAMNLRDDNGPTTAEWPLGLLRLSLLEVGRRMVNSGHASCPERAFEVTQDEIGPALLAGTGPSSAELDRRHALRRFQATLTAPMTLGTPEPTPPMSVLPPAMGKLVGMVQLVIEQMGMGGDRDALGSGLQGTGIGHQAYRGIARRAASPEEALDAMQPGDILVVAFTTPAYNVVLAIAGGIVTSVGGPLSHAAVLARELGIPAVIGAPRALIDIDDGQEIEVDPVAGEVRLVAPSPVGV